MATATATLSAILQLNQDAVILLEKGKYGEALRYFQLALSNLTVSLRQMESRSDGGDVDHPIAAVPILLLANTRDDEDNMFGPYMHAFTLFNFAMALHLRGLSEGKTAYLLKALKIYGMLDNSFQTRALPDERGWKLLRLALWNNVGHIHSLHAHFEEVKVCIGHLRELLSQPLDLPLEDLVFFHNTVFHIDIFQTYAIFAPAA